MVSLWAKYMTMFLIVRLYIKQCPSNTKASGESDEPEWAEYKIKETNMFTVDKYQQVIYYCTWKICFLLISFFSGKICFNLFCEFSYFCVCWISTVLSLQVNIFAEEKAFVLRYQTAGMLENVLRQGVLGEDDVGEEFPKLVHLFGWRLCVVNASLLHLYNWISIASICKNIERTRNPTSTNLTYYSFVNVSWSCFQTLVSFNESVYGRG